MQKDTLVQAINTVWLDPTSSNVTIPVHDIVSSPDNAGIRRDYQIPGGYPDIGIHDTMADLIVNLIGALVFAVLAAYVKTRDSNSFAARFIPRSARPRPRAGVAEGRQRIGMIVRRARLFAQRSGLVAPVSGVVRSACEVVHFGRGPSTGATVSPGDCLPTGSFAQVRHRMDLFFARGYL